MSGKAEKAKREISEYDVLKKVPLVVDYAVGVLARKAIPGCIKRRVPCLCDILALTATAFSISGLPILYVYSRGRAADEKTFEAE